MQHMKIKFNIFRKLRTFLYFLQISVLCVCSFVLFFRFFLWEGGGGLGVVGGGGVMGAGGHGGRGVVEVVMQFLYTSFCSNLLQAFFGIIAAATLFKQPSRQT